MRFAGRTLVMLFAVIGVFASIQQLRGQSATPLAGASLDHIGIVTRDVDRTVKLFEQAFGITVPPAKVAGPILLPGEAPGSAQYKVKFTRAQIGALTIELIEPAGGTGPHQAHLDQYGQGLHHLAFFVKDPQGTLTFLTGMGGRLTMNNLYADMKDQLGFTVEVTAMPKVTP
jgi:catechol 2,3-dioxygenase-like lactoylglutathione lyase family enzyme